MLCYVTVPFNNSIGGLLNDKGRADDLLPSEESRYNVRLREDCDEKVTAGGFEPVT